MKLKYHITIYYIYIYIIYNLRSYTRAGLKSGENHYIMSYYTGMFGCLKSRKKIPLREELLTAALLRYNLEDASSLWIVRLQQSWDPSRHRHCRKSWNYPGHVTCIWLKCISMESADFEKSAVYGSLPRYTEPVPGSGRNALVLQEDVGGGDALRSLRRVRRMVRRRTLAQGATEIGDLVAQAL